MYNSIITLKKEAEGLPDIQNKLQNILSHLDSPQTKKNNVSLIVKKDIYSNIDHIKKLELKERLILLTQIIAQLKIALLTNDDEKLNHLSSKLLYGDVANISGVEDDIKKAKEKIKLLRDANKRHSTKLMCDSLKELRTISVRLSKYASLHSSVKDQFIDIMGAISDKPVSGEEHDEEFDGQNE